MRRSAWVVWLLPLAALSATEFYVAPDGSDSGSGSQTRPFATLERARDAVRELNIAKKYPADGVTVWLRNGVYLREKSFDLDARDSGQAGAPVVYAAVSGETVRFVGGKVIASSAFQPVTDRAFLDRVISRAARRHLVQVDLKALGITDYGELKPMHAVDFGSSTHYLPAPLELFIDGKAATLARWPNRNDATPFLGLVDAAVQKYTLDEKGRTNSYSTLMFKDVPTSSWGYTHSGDYPGIFPQQALMAHVAEWGPLDDTYIVGGLVRAYSHTSRKIASVDPAKGLLTLATPVNVWPGYKDMARMFYFANIPDELDAPGEYYLDRKTGVLTLYPPAGFNAKSEVVVSMMNDVLVAMEGCSHIRLRNLTLEATRTSGVYVERGEDNVIEKCVIRNTGIVGVQVGFGWDTGLAGEWAAQSTQGTPAPSEVKDAGSGKPLPRLPGSLRHVLCTGMERLPTRMPGATALDRQGGKRNGLDSCTIYDTGIGGVILGGGDRKTLTPAENFVRNCNIYRTDRRVHLYAESVVVDGCGNLVEGNYLHDNCGGLLYFLGNDHLMQYNEIARGLTGCMDGGVIETRQNPSMLGNRIRFNYIHHNTRGSLDHNAQNCTIYLDNSTHGVEIFGNVFYRNIGRTVKPYSRAQIGVTEGHNHVISNNLFIDNPGVKIGDGCDFEKARKTFGHGKAMLTQDVDVSQPPYSTRYPAFYQTYTGVVNNVTNTPLYNRVFNNALIGNNEGVSPSRYPDKDYRHHNIEIDTDPGFVNEAGGDFTLRPDSRVFKDIPGFEAIPFEKMQRAKALQETNK
ncbi:MAG: right-handed parallel beta-helix repeat-containing protein [bacterium]